MYTILLVGFMSGFEHPRKKFLSKRLHVLLALLLSMSHLSLTTKMFRLFSSFFKFRILHMFWKLSMLETTTFVLSTLLERSDFFVFNHWKNKCINLYTQNFLPLETCYLERLFSNLANSFWTACWALYKWRESRQ